MCTRQDHHPLIYLHMYVPVRHVATSGVPHCCPRLRRPRCYCHHRPAARQTESHCLRLSRRDLRCTFCSASIPYAWMPFLSTSPTTIEQVGSSHRAFTERADAQCRTTRTRRSQTCAQTCDQASRMAVSWRTVVLSHYRRSCGARMELCLVVTITPFSPCYTVSRCALLTLFSIPQRHLRGLHKHPTPRTSQNMHSRCKQCHCGLRRNETGGREGEQGGTWADEANDFQSVAGAREHVCEVRELNDDMDRRKKRMQRQLEANLDADVWWPSRCAFWSTREVMDQDPSSSKRFIHINPSRCSW